MKQLSILNSIAVIILLIILSLNLNTFYWADDYAILNEVENLGLYKRCLNGYYNWDGRYLTIGAFLQGFFLKYLPVRIVTLIWSLLFLLSGYFISLFIEKELSLNFKTKISNRIFFRTFIIILFCFVSSSHFSQTVHWATGGVYTFNLFIGSLWLYFNNKRNGNFFYYLSVVILTLLLSTSTQNLLLPLMVYIIIKIVFDSKNNLKLNLFLLTIMICGFSIINFAPGNTIRLGEINDNLLTNFSFIKLLKYIVKFSFLYTKYSIFLIFSMLFLFFAFNKKIQFHFLKNSKAIKYYFTNYQFLLIAFISIVPFIVLPSLASERTSIYFLFFIFIHVMLKIIPLETEKMFSLIQNQFKLFFGFYCCLVFFYSYNLVEGIGLKNQIEKREINLKNAKNKSITIALIHSKNIPILYQFREYRSNEDWALEETKKYFMIKDIHIAK